MYSHAQVTNVVVSYRFITFSDTLTHTFTSHTLHTATSGAAGKHWKYERVVTVGLIALLPAAAFYPCAVVDYGLAVTVPLHGHW